jgi:hypothetical protein
MKIATWNMCLRLTSKKDKVARIIYKMILTYAAFRKLKYHRTFPIMNCPKMAALLR